MSIISRSFWQVEHLCSGSYWTLWQVICLEATFIDNFRFRKWNNAAWNSEEFQRLLKHPVFKLWKECNSFIKIDLEWPRSQTGKVIEYQPIIRRPHRERNKQVRPGKIYRCPEGSNLINAILIFNSCKRAWRLCFTNRKRANLCIWASFQR